MGLQVGYLMGGSILVETVFSWPGTGLLLNTAIFQRDLPLLQGTIWVLALFLCCSICWWIFCKPPSIRELRGADYGGYRDDENGAGFLRFWLPGRATGAAYFAACCAIPAADRRRHHFALLLALALFGPWLIVKDPYQTSMFYALNLSAATALY